MIRTTLRVAMKRGGKILLDVEGNIFDGAVEDLEIYWPKKKRDKKQYAVKLSLISNIDEVSEDFYEDVCQAAALAAEDAAERRAEARAEARGY